MLTPGPTEEEVKVLAHLIAVHTEGNNTETRIEATQKMISERDAYVTKATEI